MIYGENSAVHPFLFNKRSKIIKEEQEVIVTDKPLVLLFLCLIFSGDGHCKYVLIKL